MKQLGFGIIGSGNIAGVHAQAVQAADNAKLAAVFDPNAESAGRFAEKFNCRAYSDMAEFLADPEVAAVTVATPSGAHMESVEAAAEAGKHILCEKPLEISLERVDRMIEVCQQNNVLLSSIFQNRLSKPVKLLRAAQQAGRFGQMIMAGFQMHWYRDSKYYDDSPWRGTWKLDGGGALINQASHNLDLLLYINGDVSEVHAYAGTMTHNIEVEDTLCAALKFANGSFGTIEVSTSCNPGFPRRIEFTGSKGKVTIEEDSITRWDFVEPIPEDEDIRSQICGKVESFSGSSPSNLAITGHTEQVSALADAVLNGTPLTMDGREGRRAVELICAIYESVRSGKPCKLK